MRITADIFDEEPFVFDKVFNLISGDLPGPEKVLQSKQSTNDINWFFNKFAAKKALSEEENCDPAIRRQIVLQQHQKIHEVTQKLKNLHLSDITRPLEEENFTVETASSSKSMEKATGDGDVSETNPVDTPSWLPQFLVKMKYEIKKEILQELLHAPQNELLCFKAGASNKTEENHFSFQGEVVHSGIFCDNCDQLIHGIRYKCGNCSDFDLCQECESLPNIHDKYHIFLKIRYPFALKLYQKQKMLEFLTPSSGKIYMSSRNRQAKKLYEAKFLCDETIPDSTVLPPSTKFVKSWRVMNSGTRVWTHATKLHLIQGSPDLMPRNEHVDVPHLKPGEEGIVSVIFTSPSLPGVHRSHWNFCHKSRPFGDIVWCHIVVVSPTLEGETKPETVSEMKTPNINISVDKVAENKQNEASCIAQVLTAVKKEHERGNLVPRKLAVTSHTATPNNTPFDLTPPKSPDHQETSVKEVHELTANSYPISNQARDSDDDECSVVSLGSSESDTEFVVVPMPKCFNLSESFVSQHIPQWVQHCEEETDHISKIVNLINMISPENQPVIIKSTDNIQPQSSTKKAPNASEIVSQETGVPELSENACEQTVPEVLESQKDVETNYVSVVTDDCSSEISIIESRDNLLVENATQTIGSINISISSGGIPSMTELESVELLQNNPSNDHEEQEEPGEDIPCNSDTFPKFPIEGITSSYDPSPASNEERTVQVLPEGLVTGALSAAASVYNTAKAVISTMQQPRNGETCLSQECVRVPPQSSQLNPMDQLLEMGFCNRQQNEELLKKHNGDVPLVVEELVSLSDNDWYASRHIPSPPPCFD